MGNISFRNGIYISRQMIGISHICINKLCSWCIKRNTIYIILEINTKPRKDFINKVNTLWLQYLSLIIDEISIINLKLFTSINKQLWKAKKSDISSISIFGGLSIIVLIGNFYQFTLVIGKALWDNFFKKDDIYRKTL